MPDLSIVIPTYNRCRSLASCLASVREATKRPIEIIVVDGASSDGTPDVLAKAKESFGDQLRIIREAKREGFVKAANKGFRIAEGEYLMWLNDDARPLPGSLDRAMEQLDEAASEVGMIALFHPADTIRNIAYEVLHEDRPFRILHVRGTLYANFGMARRELFERLDYFDERFFLNGADPDFSLKVWSAGLSVKPAFGALIDHDELQDVRREADRTRAAADNAKLFEKWDLPGRNENFNDFDPAHPCTLAGSPARP